MYDTYMLKCVLRAARSTSFDPDVFLCAIRYHYSFESGYNGRRLDSRLRTHEYEEYFECIGLLVSNVEVKLVFVQ